MIENATGVILRTRPLTETSLIIEWLTSNQGRIHTVAKGARRPKSQFFGKLDLFYCSEFSFSRSRRSDLHVLTELKLQELHSAIRRDLGYLQQASYCATLIEQTTEPETPLPCIFDLMLATLRHLPNQPPQPQTIFAFELRLLEELGLMPDLTESTLKPGTRRLADRLAFGDWPVIARLQPSASQVSELRLFLHGFLIYHLGRVPKGRNAATGG